MSEFLLKHVDPDRNCFRFYDLVVEPNLFGDHSLVIHWGRLGRRGRTRVASSGSKAAIQLLAEKQHGRKLRKGYVPR